MNMYRILVMEQPNGFSLKHWFRIRSKAVTYMPSNKKITTNHILTRSSVVDIIQKLILIH